MNDTLIYGIDIGQLPTKVRVEMHREPGPPYRIVASGVPALSCRTLSQLAVLYAEYFNDLTPEQYAMLYALREAE
jgi:hypothetical protein